MDFEDNTNPTFSEKEKIREIFLENQPPQNLDFLCKYFDIFILLRIGPFVKKATKVERISIVNETITHWEIFGILTLRTSGTCMVGIQFDEVVG